MEERLQSIGGPTATPGAAPTPGRGGEQWPHLTHQMRDRLNALCQRHGAARADQWLSEAACECIEALAADNAALRAALAPFAEYATARDAADRMFRASGPHDDSRHIVEWGSVARGAKSYTITLGDCRRAAAALAPPAGRDNRAGACYD